MSSTPDILLEIVRKRADRIRHNGADQGLALPSKRQAPLVDFMAPGHPVARHPTAGGSNSGILIAEIKRRSPSRGDIDAIPEPQLLAAHYKDVGFRRVSVLTEEAQFGGSLYDLMAVKNAHPDLAVLRKDFLLTLEDVEVSYRAGADAILLIATLLEPGVLTAMYHRSRELGMRALVEVHNEVDVQRVRHLAPPLVGINSRDLRRFTVDPLIPLEIRSSINWDCQVVYESGISSENDVLFVRGSGFGGFLMGEALVRSPELGAKAMRAWENEKEARRRYAVWERLYLRHRAGVPLVKICGITNREDALAAVDAGADMLGFVMAPSPRQTSAALIRECADQKVLKAAVVVLKADEKVSDELRCFLDEGLLDFLQFHGDETPQTVQNWPSYKALNLRTCQDAEAMDSAGSPAVLVDAFSPTARGGTGKRLDSSLLSAAAERRRLWIAGGLNAENVAAIVDEWKPGLVDVSGGVEASKGRKNHKALRRFVAEAKGKNRGESGSIGNNKELTK